MQGLVVYVLYFGTFWSFFNACTIVLITKNIWNLSLNDHSIGHWDASSGENDIFSGKSHSNQVQCMKCVDGQLISCGMDDAVMFTDISSASFG